MRLWQIAWKSIRHRALASSLTAFSMSLGVALVVAVLVINSVISKSFQQGTQGYDLIVGPKGSKLQLVFSTVFYNQEPIGTIPYNYYKELSTSRYSSEVETAIPIARSDNYNGCPVLATTPDYFTKLLMPNGKNYSFKDGELFKFSDTFGAVVGYTAAKRNGVKIGDKIQFSHGTSASEKDLHDPFVIRGILDYSGTPNDRAVFVNLEGFYDIHEHQNTGMAINYELRDREAAEILEQRKNETAEDHSAEDHSVEEHSAEDHSAEDHSAEDHSAEDHSAEDHSAEDHSADEHSDADGHNHANRPREVSAVLIITKTRQVEAVANVTDVERAMNSAPGVQIDEEDLISGRAAHKVYNLAVTSLPERIENEMVLAQAVVPVEEIQKFFEDVIGNIQFVLLVLAVLVIIVAGIGIMVSIYNQMNERRQEIAIMRALGANRWTVMLIILLESILLSLGGGLFGLLIGHGMIGVLAPFIEEESRILVRPWDFQWIELCLIPGLLALASLVGLLPAIIAYRTDVAQSLQP